MTNGITIETLARGESKDVEFKASVPKEGHKYMKTVVAFANGRGGRIFFGVKDGTGRVVGVDEEDEDGNKNPFRAMDAIANAISDNCAPTIIPDISLQTVEGKTIIVVDIEPGRQRPYYLKAKGPEGGTYIRVAGTTRPADRETIREMYYESEGRSYDCVARDDVKISDADIERMCRAMRKVALSNCDSPSQKRGIKPLSRNQLISWGVLAETEAGLFPTNAYVFLQGLDPFHSRIQCGVFKGTTRTVFLDKRDYEGPLWEQVEGAYQFVLRNIRLGARVEGLGRRETYEIPPGSIRELIVNAAVHCSFLQSSNVQVAVYDDRLEVTSPGGLMPGVTIERMKEGFSKVRNHAIANAFAYMLMIERWGSGIPRVIGETKALGLREPEIIDMEGALRVNIYRDPKVIGGNHGGVGDDLGGNIGASGGNGGDPSGPLSANEEAILRQILANDAPTIAGLSRGTDLSRRTVERALRQLKARGIIARQGPNRGGRWVISEPGDGGVSGGNIGGNGVSGGNPLGSLSANEEEVLRQILGNGALTIAYLSEGTGLPKRTVERALRQLKEKGIIAREGSNRNGRWTVRT